MIEGKKSAVERSASPVAQARRYPSGEPVLLYQCDECKALLIDGEAARKHLWWHDTIVVCDPEGF